MVDQGKSVLSAEFQLHRMLPGIGNDNEDLWPVIFWTRMVRLRLLDNYGTGFFAIQAAAEAPQGLCIEIKRDHIWKNYIKSG